MNARKSSHTLMSILTLATFAFGLTVRAQAQAPLYNFPGGWIGGLPQSTLTLDPSGNLYGTTFIGGGNPAVCDQPGSSCGTVFKLSQSSGGNWTETVLRGFTGGTRGGRLVKVWRATPREISTEPPAMAAILHPAPPTVTSAPAAVSSSSCLLLLPANGRKQSCTLSPAVRMELLLPPT